MLGSKMLPRKKLHLKSFFKTESSLRGLGLVKLVSRRCRRREMENLIHHQQEQETVAHGHPGALQKMWRADLAFPSTVLAGGFLC